MPGVVGCIVRKALVSFVEREVGPEGVTAILQVAGRPREWLIAEPDVHDPPADRTTRVM